MSKVSDIREICGDYAFDVEYSADNVFTMFFNSRRNAMTVKRCIELDDSVPNVATAVDFVEVVRCKDCKHWHSPHGDDAHYCGLDYCGLNGLVAEEDFCSYGERREK